MSGRADAAGHRIEHFVSTAPFDPYTIEKLTPEQERYYMASQWRMMWWRLKRHRLAVIAGAVLAAMYLSIVVSEFLSPYNLHSRHTDFLYAPPQQVHLFHQGRFISDYDRHLAGRLAYIITGGNLSGPQEVTEAYLLGLEREVFLSLLGEPKTQ
ncbi:MAG: hypothetical protein IH789_06670, partial [Acidobacteria bacterium]|nr:hypothetical protein [Acidobacteriota bacterium]